MTEKLFPGTLNNNQNKNKKKVLYNIKKMKKCGVGEGEGAIFEPKSRSMYLKKEK